jgi:hypothetical protein
MSFRRRPVPAGPSFPIAMHVWLRWLTLPKEQQGATGPVRRQTHELPIGGETNEIKDFAEGRQTHASIILRVSPAITSDKRSCRRLSDANQMGVVVDEFKAAGLFLVGDLKEGDSVVAAAPSLRPAAAWWVSARGV